MSAQKKGLIRNIASLGVVQIANYVFPLISVPVISRIIGPEKFGVINFAAAFIAYFIFFIGYGFDLSATRKIAHDPDNAENRNRVFSEVFFSQCILLFISIIIFAILLNVVPQLQTEKEVAVFSFLICFSTLITQNWLFQAMQDLSKVAWFNLISKILFTIAVLVVIRERSDYIWQPLILSISQITVSVISFTWAVKKYNIKLQRVSLRNCFALLWNEKI